MLKINNCAYYLLGGLNMHNSIFTSCINSDIKYINEKITTGIYINNYQSIKPNKTFLIVLDKETHLTNSF